MNNEQLFTKALHALQHQVEQAIMIAEIEKVVYTTGVTVALTQFLWTYIQTEGGKK